MEAKSRDDCVFLAKISEQAERYPEMLEYVKGFVKYAGAQLMPEERSLLSVAYKNLTGNLRASWRIISQLEEIEGPKARPFEFALMRKQREKIERELIGVCEDVLNLLDKVLIPAALPGEEKVFYCKMKGDYYRYIAEFSRSDAQKRAATASLDAYKLAYKTALSTLEATHPTRLGLALNFSVYYRDVLNSPERACHLAKHAFDEAVAVLDQMPEQTFRDSLIILQLLRDDLTVWFQEMQEQEKRDAAIRKPL
ncbi:14-3-3 protein [Rickenella mellea]|uniref:14-3-3 protein n=1 Tax=Rickenella mellea TaxID=50990 RepID=A0A4R5XHA0_9AGAM|nr:14-3-3 protein [Rickenella mellea]